MSDHMTPTVLDVCCGSKMFWFDPDDQRAIFVDKRSEDHELKDSSSKYGYRSLIVAPDVIGDFTSLALPDDHFPLVVFGPPHLTGNGPSGWMAKKYGKLNDGWPRDLAKGFSECFRVLRPLGTLIFKWNETDIPVSAVIKLSPIKPLFGNRQGKIAKTHWIVFQKPPIPEPTP